MAEQVAPTPSGHKDIAGYASGAAPAWNRCVLLLLVAAVAYFPPWIELWPMWVDTHGVLIIAITLWLVWRARPALAGVPATPNAGVLPLVLLLSAGWLLAARANVLVAQAALWPMLAYAILWAGSGWRAAWTLAFPLAFLYFAIPFWDYLEPALQATAANIVGFLIRVAGTQASANGPYILLPDTTIFIALGCSGAQFLSVSLALGTLAGELRGDSLRMRLLLIALAGAFGILFNALRILLIVLAYLHPAARHWLQDVGHLAFGWWILAANVLVLCLALYFIPAPDQSARRHPTSVEAHPRAVSSFGGLVPAVVAALLLPCLSWAAQRTHTYSGNFEKPENLPDTTGPIAPDPRWQPLFTGAAWEHRVAYILADGRVVELYRNKYHKQSQGQELFSGQSQLFDAASFAPQSSRVVNMGHGDSDVIEAVRTELLDRSGRTWLALHTYIIDGATITGAYRPRLLTAWRALYSRPAAGIFAVATPCVPDCATAQTDLEAFALRAHDFYEAGRAP